MERRAWVTQALAEEHVEKALVLGKSLRRVLTRVPLVVIVHPSTTLALRDALEATFDYVLCLDEGKLGPLKDIRMEADTLAKCFALSFTFFDRCIYLPPNSLLLKNCDDLFGGRKSGHRLTDLEQGSAQKALSFQPNREAFRKMTEFMSWKKNDNSIDGDALFLKWLQNHPNESFHWVEEPFSTVVKLHNPQCLKSNGNISICHLPDLPSRAASLHLEGNGFSAGGLLEKFIYGYWLDIYKNEIKIPPIISDSVYNSSFTVPQHENSDAGCREPIAVVGMSCRYPSSNNLSEFWGVLVDGRDAIRTPPNHRWTKEQSISNEAETRQTPAGFLSVPVDEFDSKFFGISPKEAVFLDPQARLIHELVWEALEDGGIDPLSLNGTQTGVFMGSWRNDYYDVMQRSSTKDFFRGYLGTSIGAGSARISHMLGLSGPAISTESGCSAAMVAVHMACKSLQSGESSMALACGVNLLLHPFKTDIMPMVTAPDGHCKSFCKNANGFGRAEGAGVLVLKRLSDAMKDEDSIWGVIKGTAIAQEGQSKSIGTPTVQCEAQAMKTALRDANVHPSQVSYVEAHGTGTIIGDRMEIVAIGQVYGKSRQEPLIIGSVKTNVGHTESCSGITGIMKVILSLKHELIPQHRNFTELNPDINLEIIPARLPLEKAIPWPKVINKPRTAGVSSFGITGTDGHVIVQESLEYTRQRIILADFERPLHLMTISARTEEALDALINRYKETLSLDKTVKEPFPDIAYTTNVGRATFNWRAAVIANSSKDAVNFLNSSNLLRGEATESTKKICFLFSGQGSQYHGMAKELYDTNPVFHMHFDYCERILQKTLKISLASAFWGNEKELGNRTLYSQIGIFVIEYCLLKLWESWQVKPDCVLGHSLGEFCAAVAAGIITLEEALTLVAERSRLIDCLPRGSMLVIKASQAEVTNLVKKYAVERKEPNFWLDCAAINSPDQTVLAGDTERVLGFSEWLKARDIKCVLLQSSHAFHSRHMEPMLEKYHAVAEKIFRGKSWQRWQPSCKFISGMLGKVIESNLADMDWSQYWVQHTRDKVRFMEASKIVCNEEGCSVFLEIGPNPVLTAFIMINNDRKRLTCLPSLRQNETNWKTMLQSLAKLYVSGAVDIDWKGFDKFYDRKKVGSILPTYPFQGTKYWPDMTSLVGVHIHPLLGSNIPNPTNSKIFQNQLSLQNVGYLKDHVIGSTVVFPGAGYIETLLMAGHVTLDGNINEFRYPRRPFALENFKIEAPLGLEDGVGCQIQTIVEFCREGEKDSIGGGLYIKFYHEMRESDDSVSKWVAHASGTFLPWNPSREVSEAVDVYDAQVYQEAIERLQTGGKIENSAKEFYDKVAEVGLTFGPAFRTLQKVWRRTDGKNEFLAQVKIPSDASSYFVHPTIIDAMIQAAVFHGEKNKKVEKKLRVPIGCEKFIWFRPLVVNKASVKTSETLKEDEAAEETCYVYSTGISKTVVLLDNAGHPVAALVKVDAVETNEKSIQALLETQTRSIPAIYNVTWKPTMGPMQHRLDFEMVTNVVDVVESSPRDQSEYSEYNLGTRKDMDDMAYYYVITAFLRLGWNPNLGDILILDKFIMQLGVKQHHKPLVRHFLTYLETEGILEGHDISPMERRWKVIKLPETVDVYQAACQEIVQRLSPTDVADQILLLRNCGEKFDKIMAGTEPALRILFPEDQSKPSVGKFYDSAFVKSKEIMYRALSKTWESCRASYEQKNQAMPIVRILEVGAGTGSITDILIESMETYQIPYEFHYTDISAAFFPAAEKRFEKYKKNIIFRKLNLEQDATCQGFAPKYFDLIFGAQVIHATRDIKETFVNLRQLLRDGGNLIVNETLIGRRLIDCIFGILEGFWRYTDFNLRPHHPMMSIEQWCTAADGTGFTKVSHSRVFETAVVAYGADSGDASGFDMLSRSLNPDMRITQYQTRVGWVVFYREEEEEYIQRLKKKFEYLGRKTLILVEQSRVPDLNLELAESGDVVLHPKYAVRPEAKQDMENLFAILKKHVSRDEPYGFSSFEGILVTWGLCGGGTDQENMARPFLNLVQSVIKLDKKALPQMVVLTAGQYPVGDVLCENPTSSTLIGVSRCVANEYSELRLRGIDVDLSEIYSSMEMVFQEIFTAFNDNVSHFCAFRGADRFVPKVFPEKVNIKNGSLATPSSTDRFQLIHPKSKSIQDLEFGDLSTFTLGSHDIEVKVKCSALNFKDIFNILKPTDEFKDSNAVGFDFAGIVTAIGNKVSKWRIGDPVFGINIMGNALPSHIALPEDVVVSLPDTCTFTEAACFPAVFSTAYYCLVNVARCQRGDTLLIHTASGGVGLLTIQLAKYFGLNVICTAGNKRKRAYLRSQGIQYVFHSRNTCYGKKIMEVTNGRGVNIVLNSLTGPGFKEATLGACAKGARFVEMSKLNIWTEKEMAAQRPDVDYSIVDLTQLDVDTSRKLLEESYKFVSSGVVKPIPYTRFDGYNIREALTYLQKAQHIGKVVVTMPDKQPGQLELAQLYCPLFNERSSYLITGGLGGIGLAVCQYMVNQGARNIILVGRKPPTDQTTEIIIKLRTEQNCNITVIQADVGDWEQCQGLFNKIKDPALCLPPLRGIMHCAGTLADALVENVKWEDFCTTYQAKIAGSWNLHKLTMDTILEHFVFFSSVTAPFGSPGQATHVSACTFEDTMAHYRNSHGLTATTINWGQFGQIGIAAEADVISIRPFSPQQGINALDYILRQNKNNLIVASLDKSLATVLKFLPYTKKIVDEQVIKAADVTNHLKTKSLLLRSTQFWEEYNDCKEERERKVEVVKKFTKIMLRHVLRLDTDEPIDENTDLQDMGVDSLMMLELKNHIQEVLGERATLTQAAMKDCTTVILLSDRLVQLIEEEGEFSRVEPPTLEEVRALIVEDCVLPDFIRAQMPGSERKPSAIKVALVTGATGTLGGYLLRAMLEEYHQLEKVYCLVRTRGAGSAMERLTDVLERKCLMGSMINFDKVVPIAGNILDEKLGLSEADYQLAVEEVDAVVHCSAKVNHIECYRKVNGGRSDARSVNVGGLLKLLEFCATGPKTKYCFNMSTFLAVGQVKSEDDTLLETWPDSQNLCVTHNKGYQNSKYVCDLLLRTATHERDIPCKSFRFAELRSSAVTGDSLVESSHFMRTLLFFMREGIMPDLPIASNVLPIDVASKIACRIMFLNDAPNEVYNVCHPQPQLLQEYFPKLAQEMGHTVTIVDFEEYRKRVLNSPKENGNSTVKGAVLAEFQDLYRDEDSVHMVLSGGTDSIRKFLENVNDFFKSKRLSELVPDLYGDHMESSYEINKRDFLAAKREGIFEKFGL